MAESAGQGVAHMVYFTLKDSTPENRAALLASAQEHLSGHDGVTYFSVGQRAPEFTRPVNDDQFDIALHVVFEDRAAHDTYQQHPRHKKFIEQNDAQFGKIRVFDSWV